jgi:exodeoxyribonuclease V alpha subunit
VIGDATTSPTQALSGLVERVTYHNVENGFCVLRVKARGQRDLVAVVGHAAAVSAGEFVAATGWWVSDRGEGLRWTMTRVWGGRVTDLRRKSDPTNQTESR